jgi:hypothetical protein
MQTRETSITNSTLYSFGLQGLNLKSFQPSLATLPLRCLVLREDLDTMSASKATSHPRQN